MTSLLELAADLERRDAAIAAEIDRVGRLADGAKEIAARADAIGALLANAPAEHAAMNRAEAGALDLRQVAEHDFKLAAAAVARLDRERHRRRRLAVSSAVGRGLGWGWPTRGVAHPEATDLEEHHDHSR